VSTTAPTGLTAAEVQERVARGQTNDTGERTSRKLSEIVRANVFTRFNAILGAAVAVILVIGPIQDATVAIILVANSAIGIFQEVRAKRKLDQLAVQNATPVRVVRDGGVAEVATGAVVLDDLVELRAGDQIQCDGEVRAAEGLEVDESLLTGESDPVNKNEADKLLSGSFVVAGSGRFQATGVGPESYAAKLATEARRFQLTRSELMYGINTILRLITWLLFPVCALLLWSQLKDHELDTALRSTVAGVVAMVPEGLVLLTSVAFMLAAVTLARRKVLVQELPAVEGLARVDIVCLDKTGTLTEGSIVFDDLEVLDGGDKEVAGTALGALADDPNRNATAVALADHFSSPEWTRTGAVPFSSARKWSAATFDGQGSWVMGAPEMVFTDNSSPVRARADELASSGRRTLVLAHSDAALTDETMPADLAPVALVMFAEKVRPDAAETLAYFAAQGVELRVHGGGGRRARRARRRRRRLRCPRAPRGPGRDGRGARAASGLWSGDATAEAGDGRCVAVEGSRGGDDRRRRERRARIEGRRHRRRDGVGRSSDPCRRAARAPRRQVLHASGGGGRGPAGHGQHRAIREPVRDQDRLRGAARHRGLGHQLAVSVPSAPPDDHQHVHHRHPGLLPRPGTQLAAIHPRVHRSRVALLHPRRHRRRQRRVGRLRHRPLRPRPPDP
jgi:P-type E1-E2 ATPase